MRRHGWKTAFGLSLVALSAAVYFVHFLVFRDAHHILIYLVGDVAFVPVEVLLVTLILHRLLEVRERRSMLRKLNMVIGAFFSEVGRELMERLARGDPELDSARERLVPEAEWTKKDFAEARRFVTSAGGELLPEKSDLGDLKAFLAGKRSFLLALLENPNLLEHESFTDLLWAVFHLAEELEHRKDPTSVPEADFAHLAGDMKRVYGPILAEWISYMGHLRAQYPYLFSLAARTNPFDPSASPEVK